jgi:hypothetical protein
LGRVRIFIGESKMIEGLIITEEMKTVTGVESDPSVFEIEKEANRKGKVKA